MEITSYCEYPFKELKIKPNGDCFFCSYQETPIGNICNQSFDDIWFSDFADKVREKILTEFPIICQTPTCPRNKLYNTHFGEYPIVLNIVLPDSDQPTNSISKPCEYTELKYDFNQLNNAIKKAHRIHFEGTINPEHWLNSLDTTAEIHFSTRGNIDLSNSQYKPIVWLDATNRQDYKLEYNFDLILENINTNCLVGFAVSNSNIDSQLKFCDNYKFNPIFGIEYSFLKNMNVIEIQRICNSIEKKAKIIKPKNYYLKFSIL